MMEPSGADAYYIDRSIVGQSVVVIGEGLSDYDCWLTCYPPNVRFRFV